MKVLTCLVCMIALIMTVIAGFIFFSPDPLAANGGAGNPGVQGEQGESGVGIVKVEIVNGEFVITYTDGNVVNLGPLVVEQGTPGLEYYPLPNGTLGVKTGTALYMEEIVIPATYNGWAVTEILPESFRGSTNLKQIHLSDSVTSIGDWAFSGCTGLTSIVIPDGVTSIGDFAFSRCNDLTEINLPDGVTSIGDYAFSYCHDLTSIVIPDSVTSIDQSMFYGCINLTSIVIPDGVTSIGGSAFYGCNHLTDIYYTGTEEEWNAITKFVYWDYNTGSYTIHYNYVPD